MVPLLPIPSSPFIDYTLLRQFIFFSTDGLPLMADAIHLGGSFTPTLLDVAAIVGLRPHGITLSIVYNLDGVNDFEAHLDLKADLAYAKFIRRFAGQSTTPVTMKEHTTFHLYWLCHNLLCTHS
uniref:Aminotransferase-like plant mobile domain-containing protein n=1 Tax=Ananas comosus var. bracteatus TaxID=296719 RepID=A0A6V7P5W3_ANACO|nr:unnamed protein product [Ananas comosus var. bracteatus]